MAMNLSTELTMLLFAIVLGLVHIIAAAQMATKQMGVKWNMSSREGKPPELTGAAGRLDRASKNFRETFVFFVAAVLMAQLSQHTNWMTALGAQIYFFARLVYLPIYAIGIPGVRTLVWIISIIGLVMILIPLFQAL